MNRKIIFLLLLAISAVFILQTVCADELNETAVNEIESNGTADLITLNNSDSSDISPAYEPVKSKPVITLKKSSIKSKDTLTVYLKNSSGSPLKSKNLTFSINNTKYTVSTNSKGTAGIKVSLPAKTYKLTVSFSADSKYKSVFKKFNIRVSKIDTKITPNANFLLRGKYLYADLSGNGNPLFK